MLSLFDIWLDSTEELTGDSSSKSGAIGRRVSGSEAGASNCHRSCSVPKAEKLLKLK